MTTTRKPAPIKCVAPWAGSKRTLAPRIVELLGEHDTYVEPFVGGCSILPAKPRAAFEIINDANPAVVNVLQCVRNHAGTVKTILDRKPFDRETFETAKACVANCLPTCDPIDPELAAAQLVVWWMGANGLAGTTKPGWFARRHTKTGGDPAVRWYSFLASLLALSDRLQGVRIGGLDWQELLGAGGVVKAGTAIYVDPPYFTKSFRYAVDFAGMNDHLRLARFLNELKGRARIVVSYYDERDEASLFGGGSLLDDFYPPERWERHEVKVSKASANARTGATKTTATEVLLVNRGGK